VDWSLSAIKHQTWILLPACCVMRLSSLLLNRSCDGVEFTVIMMKSVTITSCSAFLDGQKVTFLSCPTRVSPLFDKPCFLEHTASNGSMDKNDNLCCGSLQLLWDYLWPLFYSAG